MFDGSRDFEKDLKYQGRRDRLLKICRGNEEIYIGNNTETDVKTRLIVDRTHNFIYCAIEKIGSTFWKRIVQILIGYRKTNNPFDIRGIEAHAHFKTLQKVSFDQIHVLLENSTKFLFVREPYARLLSGYVDKLFSPNSLYWRYIGTYVIRYFRNNPTNHSIKCGHDVTFREFIDYFIDSERHNRHRNGHFTPSYDHCRPCQIKYDIIGKLETFRNDTLYILDKLGLESLIYFPDFNKDTEVDALIDAIDNLYAMRNAVMKCMPFSEALLRIWKKMQIRGILSKDIPFPYSLKSTPFITLADFSQTLLDAHARSGPREQRLKNRENALIEAFQQIDPEQLQKLKKILEPDCKIFGYNSEPPQIFKTFQYVRPFFFLVY